MCFPNFFKRLVILLRKYIYIYLKASLSVLNATFNITKLKIISKIMRQNKPWENRSIKDNYSESSLCYSLFKRCCFGTLWSDPGRDLLKAIGKCFDKKKGVDKPTVFTLYLQSHDRQVTEFTWEAGKS